MTSSHSGTPAGSRERKVGHESSSVTVERTLDDAHRLLRQGKVDGAIEVYAEVLEERPGDWPAANRLGDLYVQAERLDEAVEQFTRVAQCLWERDLLPKAAALYKKVLKLRPEDEPARDRLAEIALRQGFLVDALAHLTALVDHRRAAGDDEGAIAVEQRIGQLRRRQPPHLNRTDRARKTRGISTRIHPTQGSSRPTAPSLPPGPRRRIRLRSLPSWTLPQRPKAS